MATSRTKIRMVSTGTTEDGKPTGYFKSTTRMKNALEKLKRKYFDKRAWNKKTGRNGMHVEFVEKKMK